MGPIKTPKNKICQDFITILLKIQIASYTSFQYCKTALEIKASLQMKSK